jgi:hypothetical protein
VFVVEPWNSGSDQSTTNSISGTNIVYGQPETITATITAPSADPSGIAAVVAGPFFTGSNNWEGTAPGSYGKWYNTNGLSSWNSNSSNWSSWQPMTSTASISDGAPGAGFGGYAAPMSGSTYTDLTGTSYPASYSWNASNNTGTYKTILSLYGSGAIAFPTPGSYALSVDTWNATPSYTYSANAILGSFTVAKATPAGFFANESIQYGANLTGDLNAGFSNPYNVAQASAPTGTVTYTATSTSGGAGWTNGTQVSSSTVLPAGTYTVTATYSGDSNYNPAAVSATFTVAKANQYPPVSISPANQTLSQPGSVTFMASGGSGTGAYVWGGSASGTGTTNTVSFSTPGTYTVTVYRAGDSNFNQSENTASASVTLKPYYIDPKLNVLAPSP